MSIFVRRPIFSHLVGILNAYLGFARIADGGWWIIMGVLHFFCVLHLSRSMTRYEIARKELARVEDDIKNLKEKNNGTE